MGTLVVFQNGQEVARHQLGSAPVIVGRQAECGLRLLCGCVSRQHAAFVEKEGVAGLRNLSVSNPTQVNGTPVQGTVRLKSGDRIQIGTYVMEYCSDRPGEDGEQKKTCVMQALDASLLPPRPLSAPFADSQQASTQDTAVFPLSPPEAPPTRTPPTPAALPTPTAFPSAPEAFGDSTPPPFAPTPRPVSVMPSPRLPSVTPPPGISVEANGEGDEDGGAICEKKMEDSVLLGEFEAEEDMEIGGGIGGGDGEPILEIPAPLKAALLARLAVFEQIDALENERQKRLGQEGLGEAASAELKRQSREAQNLPPVDSARAALQKQEEKRRERQEKTAAGEAMPALPADFEQAMELAVQQWKLILRREELEPAVLQAAVPMARAEPLYKLLAGAGLQPEAVFGWAVYALALDSFQVEVQGERKALQERLQQGGGEKGKGLFGRLWGGADKGQPDPTREAEAKTVAQLLFLSREKNGLEPKLTERFWALYAQAAGLMVRLSPDAPEMPYLRAFLRYGLLGTAPAFLTADKVRAILEECARPPAPWSDSMAAMRVFYADEYLLHVAQGKTTPAIDENLELNERQSDRWKADKSWRRILYTRIGETALRETAERLKRQVETLRGQQEEMEAVRGKLVRGAPDFQKRNSELAQKIQHCRVEAARFERAVVRIEDDLLFKQQRIREDAELRLREAGEAARAEFESEPMARREAAALHRISRLCANLKDVFPPFTLRDSFRPTTDVWNQREAVLADLAQHEKSDPAIFVEPLVSAKKKASRIDLRFSPIVVLTPTCGFLGYSWNPRSGAEIGRLALPAYCPRPRLRDRILPTLLADFRYDTSKASAGVDALTADTITAAYATVRWEYRKSSKEAREKAAIFLEDNDRKNWRRHYALYLQSALDGGKKLFHKCPEVYDLVIIKYFDLPDGVERLRR